MNLLPDLPSTYVLVALMCVTKPRKAFSIFPCQHARVRMDDFLALLSCDKAREKFIVYQVVLFDMNFLISLQDFLLP